MKFSLNSHYTNIILLVLLIILGGGSFAYNNHLLHNLLKKERSRVALWARAMKVAGSSARQKYATGLNTVADKLEQNRTIPDSLLNSVRSAANILSTNNFAIQQVILNSQFKIPAIITDENRHILASSHLPGKANQALVDKMAGWHEPIQISFGPRQDQRTQYVYYGESSTIRYLRWFPYIQFVLLILLLGMAFVSFRTIYKSEQSNILVGMTREAAHQLGTPLSSIYGWIGLLKTEKPGKKSIERAASGLENDADRLQGIADRFNKIGSKPELETCDLTPHINMTASYIKQRLPQYGREVTIKKSIEGNIKAKINPELFKWALENILKNAINALNEGQEEAFISIEAKRRGNRVQIDIQDSGHGISKKYHKKIFKPGYSTKKRGWGLGLSLTKRIIENYHDGTIFVARSEPEKGTTIRILL